MPASLAANFTFRASMYVHDTASPCFTNETFLNVYYIHSNQVQNSNF